MPDSRLVIVLHNFSPQSKDNGGFIAWIGSYGDLQLDKPDRGW